MLKLNPEVEELTAMVPVATVQVGWVIVKVGTAGIGGCGLTVTLVGRLMTLIAFFEVTL